MITLKKSFSNWIKIAEDESGNLVEFYIEYPDLKAQQILDRLKYDSFSVSEESPQMNGGRWIDYIRHYVKFHVRDWRGIEDKFEAGADGYMTDALLLALTRNEQQLSDIYLKIQQEVEFTGADKKK